MDIGFGEALLILGAILAVTAFLSGWFHGTVLSISVLSVAVGIVLAASGVVDPDPKAAVVGFLVEIALLLTLFSDGLYAERELLRHEWHAPARALVIAMPITLVLLAVAAKALFGELSWEEAFLVGAVLSPTDPVVTSTVVTSRSVPALIRHTLNLESGLNDGLALPLVLFFLVLAENQGGALAEAGRLLGEVAVGALIGVGVAAVGAGSLRYAPGGSIVRRYEGVYGLGLAFAAFGLAEVTYGNGLIAAFVAGMALAATRIELPETFTRFNESVSGAFQVMTFVVFGALIVATGWFSGSTLALAAFVAFALLVARPAAVLLSFVGLGLPRSQKLFVAWFGPKGVASMLFALLVANSDIAHETLVFDIASFVILSSIIAHGLTDTLGANWMRRVADRSTA
ncbi:MAG TPA: cation:proton antiporter [Gaiellaceae bacterium]|jgi:NhaP-type Na+/H+ or K+/H+ antiporter|nr:cation:proton antiporter [Gaiellaceae bacterium]